VPATVAVLAYINKEYLKNVCAHTTILYAYIGSNQKSEYIFKELFYK